MPRTNFAATNAVFVDENFVAIFVFEFFEHFEIRRVVGVNHHFVETIGEASVIIGVPATIFHGDFDDGRNAAKRRIIFPNVVKKQI